MRHGLFKRVIAMTICVSSFTGLLTGCGENPDEYIDNFTSEMQARIQANQAEVDKLQLAGLLSQESAESLKKSIANQESTVTTMSSVGDLSQYTYRIKSDGTLHGLGVRALRKDAMSIVSDDDKAMEELMNNLDYNIYVLKKQDGDMNTLETLDIIAREVERAKNGEPTNIDHYFVDSGRKVWDFSDPDNKIVRPTLENPAFSENATEGSNVLGLNYVGVKVHVLENGKKESVDAIEVTMYEFNPSAISRLIGADGVNKDVYVIYNNNCYLMQYPVYYVSGWKKEGNDYEAVYKKSDLQINLLTNKVLDSYGNECFNEMGNIYNVSGDGKYNELGQASFVVDGVTGEATTFGYDEKDDGSDTYKPLNSDNYGRVVLRDYLELNYMPGVVDNETMVALGRRVRLTKFAGTGKEDIGLFIDKQGNEVENSLRIKITDIMDVNSGQGDNEGKRLKLDLQYSYQAA